MANLTATQTIITEVQTTADTILQTIKATDPNLTAPTSQTQAIVDLTAVLVASALSAWSAASGLPITPESVAALMPNATPLTAPDK